MSDLEVVEDAGRSAAALLPLRRGTAVDEVTDRLLTAVALGAYVPGERLPVERELCAILAVSRSTVRQALARLRAAGVVEVRRGRTGGAYVTSSWTAASAGAVRRTPDAWLLVVSDGAEQAPPHPDPERDPSLGGLGLRMVADLSAAYGWCSDGGLKHVWALVDAG